MDIFRSGHGPRMKLLLSTVEAVDDLLCDRLYDDEETTAVRDDLRVSLEQLRIAAETLKRQSSELASRAERYQRLFDAMPDAHVLTDMDAVVTQANAAACRLLECPRERLLGQPLLLYVATAARPGLRQLLHTLAAGMEPGPVCLQSVLASRAGELGAAFELRVVVDPRSRTAGLFWLLRGQ